MRYSFLKLFVFVGSISLPILSTAQRFVFEEPVPLEIINSEAEEINPVLSTNDSLLYFVRGFHPQNIGGEYSGTDIWMSTKDSLGLWTQPTNRFVKGWNNHENNAVIGVKGDGNVVFLLNSYARGKGIAFSKKINGNWIKPELLPLRSISREDFIGLRINKNFDVLMLAMNRPDSYGQEDLYVMLKDNLGRWTEPINLGPTINTQGFEISPFLTPDNKYLFFASNGHQGLGDADIFVSERLYEDWTVWTKPVNLGENINSEKFDAYFQMGLDSTVYFSSNRNSQLADIYVSKIKKNTINILRDSINQILNEADSILTSLEQFNENRNLIFNLKYRGDEYILDNEMKATLNNFIRNVDRDDLLGIVLKGFPEKYGNNNLNLQLIEKRNKEVKKYLVKSGFDEKSIASKLVTFQLQRSITENTVEIKFIYR